MLYEYLQEKGATGAENAISTAAIQAAFKLGRRGVVQLAADERKAGRLICTGGGAGGSISPPLMKKSSPKESALKRALSVARMPCACSGGHVGR